KVTEQYERNDCTPAYPTHVPRDSAIHSTDNYQRQQWEKWIQSKIAKGPPNGDERLQDRCVSVPVQHFRQKLCVPSLAYEIGRRNEPDLEEQTRSKRREKSDEVQAKLPQGALALPRQRHQHHHRCYQRKQETFVFRPGRASGSEPSEDQESGLRRCFL